MVKNGYTCDLHIWMTFTLSVPLLVVLADDETRRLDEEELKQMIKVLVSDGQVFGLKREDPSQISWSTKVSETDSDHQESC